MNISRKRTYRTNEAIIIIYYFSSFTTYWTHYTTFMRYYQERNYSTIPFKSRNVHIDFQILPLLLPCSMIPSGTLRKHTEPLHFTLTNNVYFPKVSLTLSILYQWTRNIDLIIFSEDFEHGENWYSIFFPSAQKRNYYLWYYFYFDLNSFQLSWI